MTCKATQNPTPSEKGGARPTKEKPKDGTKEPGKGKHRLSGDKKARLRREDWEPNPTAANQRGNQRPTRVKTQKDKGLVTQNL